jgi:acetyl-CoA carboxylase carboxyl transferase subunit alpha
VQRAGAGHPRPGLQDFIQRLFPGFVEIHGDRRFADDHAIMTGFAEYHGAPVLLVGHVKGTDTKDKIFRNFGYARPEGYRKAMRAMRLAEKFNRPTTCSWTRRQPTRGSSPRSAASPKPSPRTSAT